MYAPFLQKLFVPICKNRDIFVVPEDVGETQSVSSCLFQKGKEFFFSKSVLNRHCLRIIRCPFHLTENMNERVFSRL